MSSPFQTEQMTLAALFDGHRVFSFPAFQRPYRWSIDEALTLLDDIASAASRQDDGYFLGNLVLTKNGDNAVHVIDGRQRLTTLFILLCKLRDLASDPNEKQRLHNVVSRGDGDWCLAFPLKEQKFIEALIANPSRPELTREDGLFISDRLGAMLEVSDAFHKRLSLPPNQSGLPAKELIADYLLNRCEVIALTATKAASGLRLFQVLNNRGLQLSEADLIKPDLLQALTPENQQRAASLWDDLEDQLGARNLDVLLRTYVFIKSGDWISPGRDFSEALKGIVLSQGAEAFHFSDLPRYGDAFARIMWSDVDFEQPTRNPNHLLAGLSFLGRGAGEWKEYLPVALEMLVRFEDDDERLFTLISALDRTFFVWFINETPDGARRNIAYRVIMQLREGDDPLSTGGTLAPIDAQLTKALDKLTQPFPKLYQRGALIRRIELELCLRAGRPIPDHMHQTTSEHILPKNPKKGSQWAIDFTRRDHTDCLDLLGNGVPLSRDLDKRVGNKDFFAKKAAYQRAGADRYFESVKQVCAVDKWTPDEIKARTETVAQMLKTAWTAN